MPNNAEAVAREVHVDRAGKRAVGMVRCTLTEPVYDRAEVWVNIIYVHTECEVIKGVRASSTSIYPRRLTFAEREQAR